MPTIPASEVTGLGTMATQNASAVTITGGTADSLIVGGTTPDIGEFSLTIISGGTIDNTVLGSITPAAGTFSSMTSPSVAITGGTVDGTYIGASNPSFGFFSYLVLSGPVFLTQTTQTSNYTVGSDYTVFANSSSGMTVSLPASPNAGRTVVIKNIATTGTVTVNTTDSSTIDNSATQSLTTLQSITVQFDGTHWWITQ